MASVRVSILLLFCIINIVYNCQMIFAVETTIYGEYDTIEEAKSACIEVKSMYIKYPSNPTNKDLTIYDRAVEYPNNVQYTTELESVRHPNLKNRKHHDYGFVQDLYKCANGNFKLISDEKVAVSKCIKTQQNGVFASKTYTCKPITYVN